MRFSAGTFTHLRGLLHLPPRHLRHPLRRRRGRLAQDDVRRPPLPPRRPPRPHQGPRRLPRPHPSPSPTSGSPPAATSPPTGAPATPPPPITERPTTLAKDAFVQRYGSIFEHSPWIAERAYDLELGPAHDTATGLASALARAFRSATPDERLAVLKAHPDLAGKLAAAKRLTAESTAEQAGAGLDSLTDAERARFTELNDAYQAKFGFPFIIAVRGLDKARILQAFETRVANDRDQELATACAQVERIALLRLKDMLP